MRSKIAQARKNSPQQGSATKDTSSGSRGFAGFIPEEETSSSRDNAGEAQGARVSPPTESSANTAMNPTQPLVTTRADSQDAAVEKQPSTETAELLSEEDEDIEASGSDPQQPLEGNDSPSVFFDGSQEMDMLRATLVKLKTINREQGGSLDEINKMVKRVIARNNFIARQVTKLKKEPLIAVITKVFESFEEEVNHWRGVERTYKEKEAQVREKIKKKVMEQIEEEVENLNKLIDELEYKEKAYQEEKERMEKRHVTELDAKDSLIISLRDRIRFLEGKPMSTGTEIPLASGKETVSLLTRVSEPLEFSPAQFTPTPDRMPVRAKPLYSRRPANANEQAEQERAEARAQEEAENRRVTEVQDSSQPQSRRTTQASRTWEKGSQDHYGPGLQRSQSSSSMTGANNTPMGASTGGQLLSAGTPASPGGASMGGGDPALSAALVASSIPDAFKPRKLKSLEAREVQHFREMLQFHKNRAIALKSEEWLALIEPKFHVAIMIRLRALLHPLDGTPLYTEEQIRCWKSWDPIDLFDALDPARKVHSGQELHTRIRNLEGC